MAKNLYDLIKGSEMDAMASMNPEIADAFMAFVERIIHFCRIKRVNPRQVAITGPNFQSDGKITFKVKYGPLDPGTTFHAPH